MSSQAISKCPQCGAPLKENAPAGLCPNCLMGLNLKTETAFSGAPPAAQPALPPEEIAPYFPQLEILEFLGRGGMGVVYKARQKSLNRLVALKLLAPERAGDPEFAARFEKEARALAALNHPNIVTIYDHGQAGGFYFLLMEFIDGVTLRQLLDRQRVSAREALAIVPQICDALQFAHDQGIVHRDIKPENILMDRRGRVKVADFGLAKIVEGGAGSPLSDDATQAGSDAQGSARPPGELTDAGKVMGTPQYMSPEQKENPGEVDHRADIYALGVVFYQMLTGELPGKKIVPPSKKVQIDVRLDEIVLRALETKPDLRYQQASIFRTQIETLAESPGVGGKSQTAKTGARPLAEDLPPYSFAIACAYAATILFAVLCDSFAGPVRGFDLIEFFAVTFVAALVLAFGLKRRAGEKRRRMFRRIAVVSGSIAILPVLSFTMFAAVASVREGGRWNPGWDEFVIMMLLGAVLLPVSLWRLTRGAVRWVGVAGFVFLASLMIVLWNARLSAEPNSRAPHLVPTRLRQLSGPPFIAQLPYGGNLELLAVRPYPSTNSPWWQLDGEPADYDPGITPESDPLAGDKLIALARLTWPTNFESWPRPYGAATNVTAIGLKRGSYFALKDGRRLPMDNFGVLSFAEVADGNEETTLYFHVATADWQTLTVQKPGLFSLLTGGPARKEWSFSESPDGSLKVRITHLVEREDMEYRLVAVDVDGMEHVPSNTERTRVSTETFSTFEATFGHAYRPDLDVGLSLSRLREVHWEARPYESVEFRHVSLQSGHRTQVEIKDFDDMPASTR